MTEPRLGPDALPLLEPGAAVRRRTTPGGAGPEPVARAARTRRRPASTEQARVADALSRRRSRASFYARDARALAPRAAQQGAGARRSRAPGGSRRASSRSRRTAGAEDPGSHAYRGHDAAQRDDVRPARAPVRVLHLRHALVRERRRRRRRGRRARCCCVRPRRSTGSTSCAPAGRRRAATATCARDRPGSRRRSGSPATHDGTDLVRGVRCASSTTACRRRAARR